MARRRQKQYFIGNTSRSGLGLGRRSMFVSQEKQAQHQAARRLKIWSRVVAATLILALVGLAAFFIWFYLLPYFHQEIFSGQTQNGDPNASMEPLPDYDDMGLPAYENSISLFLINENNPADPEYEPKLAQIENIMVDVHIVDALRQMTAAAEEDGFVLIFSEGYVSYEEQGKRFQAKVEELMEGDEPLSAVMAKTTARTIAPMAGESDFQTGMCLRLAMDKDSFEQSKTYIWLKANMGRYGFVFRYPQGKDDYTGMSPDLTVLRYVGGANAASMQQRSMCLEEYIDYLDL